MRLIGALLLVAPVWAHAQVWEKPIAPGIVYRMDVDTAVPRVIHAVRFAREAQGVRAKPELAQGSVFGRNDDRKGREVLSETMVRTQALVGVNGDFFPWTGDPLGAMVSEGELLSRPFPGRSVFAWGSKYSAVARLTWSASAKWMGGTVKIDGLNELCTKDNVVLNTSAAGAALSDGKSLNVVFEVKDPVKPSGTVVGKVVTLVPDDLRVPVGKGQAVLTATGQSVSLLEKLMPGDEITVTTALTGVDWSKAQNVVGGGPVVVSEGKPIQAWDAEDFKAEFYEKRHPRTAIGITKEGDIWLVQIEGRQALSAGATIDELSSVMVRFGCVDALNLDGGGSSEIALPGMIVNRPSDGVERPLANSILLFSPAAPTAGSEFAVVGLPRVVHGQVTDYKVTDSKGGAVPNSMVVWSASGDAWIDQSGRLRTLQPGKATIKAWIQGAVATVDVTVEAAPKKSPGSR